MSTFVIILIMVGFFAGSVYWGMSRWRQSRSASPSLEAFLAQHQTAAGMLPVAQAQPQMPQVPQPPRTATPIAEPDLWPFAQKPRVITAPQQVLYFRLRNALPEHVVLCAAPLAQFLEVGGATDVEAWHRRIAGLSVDFLVCTKAARVALAVDIEPRGTPAEAEHRKQKALAAAGIQLLRVQSAALPAESAIAGLLKSIEGSRPP